MLEKCGYTDRYTVYLCDPITLHSDRDVVLSIEYTSRVEDEDMSVGFVVPALCENFTLEFSALSEMTVYAYPYSFFSTENYHPNNLFKHDISIHYTNWMLSREGVALCVSEEGLEETLRQSYEEQPFLEITN